MLPNLNPDQLANTYEFLRALEPFKKYRLPDADQVEFCVTRHRDRAGDHTIYCDTDEHIIRASACHVTTVFGLIRLMAHEMIHMVQTIEGTNTKVMHNKEFKRLAKIVCEIQGYEFKTFV